MIARTTALERVDAKLRTKRYFLESSTVSPAYFGARFNVGNSSQRPDILCFSHLRWQFVTQRPQHLLTRAARGRRVFFWEEPLWHKEGELQAREDGGSCMRVEILSQGPSLWVIQPHLTHGMDPEESQRTLLAEFMQSFHVQNYVLWYYTPMALGFTGHLSPTATVYDCMDELSAFLNAPPELVQREQQLFQKADVVFTGGFSLYEAKRLQHPNVHAFPSSIDAAHFAQSHAKQDAGGSKIAAEPSDQAAIPHPRAGFYGVVDERFDIALLGETARLRPAVHFIVLGPVVKIDPAVLPKADNIHYLGGKTYDELPRYLAGWDVALLPFAMNDATRFISPTKTPEYLAAGKPVVSTPIRDVVRTYGDPGLVAIAATAEEFATAIDNALHPPAEAWRTAVAAKLAESSWDSTWAAMQREIDTVRLKPSFKETSAPSERPTGFDEYRTASSIVSRAPASPIAPRGVLPASRCAERFDYLVVGAGFAGSVLAERLASQLGQRVLVVEKREHIAGNAYDCYNEDGVLIHKYGPHIFHTNSEKVLNYLSRFTQWRPYEHRVLSSVDGHLLPVPINLDTINHLFDLNLDADGMKAFLAQRAENLPAIRTSEDSVVSRVGRELYEKFFRNYTRKQWGLDPSQLDASVAARIPVRFDHDDRYFTDTFQVMPLKGYTRMFERMLDHSRITIRTGVDYKDIARSYPETKIIYTGPIDEYFDFRFGPLPYRSLEFKHETHNCEVFQPAPVVNYPNDHAYTRITEFKYLTGQKHAKTSIVYEYPRAKGDPYYPIPRPENAALYARYKELADASENVHFCGRLANYRYLNMDQVVGQALATFQRIAERQTIKLPALVVSNALVSSSRVPSE
jgi:UDP-galactopyranose mutase